MKTTEQPQATAHNALNRRIKKFFHPGVDLTKQEEAMVSILCKVLELPGTIKITPLGGPYYVVGSKETDCVIRVGIGTVTIMRSSDTIYRDVKQTFSDLLRGIVEKAVNKDVDALEETVLNGEIEIMDRINATLSTYAETPHSTGTESEGLLHE